MKHTLLSSLSAAALALVLAVGVAACSSPSSSSDTSGGTPSKKSEDVSKIDWGLARSQCMRDLGHDFPDPDANGDVPNLAIDGDTWAPDMQKCTDQVTDLLGPAPATDEEKKSRDEGFQAELAYSDCLRKKGYDIEDPDKDAASGNAIGPGVDRSGQKISVADVEACKAQADL